MNTCFFRSIYLLLGILFFTFPVIVFSAQPLTVEEIIDQIDRNMVPSSLEHRTKMIIHQKNRIDEKEMIAFALAKDTTFAFFVSPAKDKGTKYLKMGDNMWMYLPSVEKVIKIAGHMLRQSMMGSDFSYEDSLEMKKLRTHYDAEIVGEEQITGRICYILDLTANKRDVTYYRRKIWVDKEHFIILKSELYAKSGKLLKEMTSQKVEQFNNRYYPTHSTMKNKLRKNSKTEMITVDIKFDVNIPDELFSIRNLKRNIPFLQTLK